MKAIFQGIKVVDFTNNVAGPLATAMMADFGAEVIKIEKPVYGDDSRQFVPFVEGKSVTFMWLNRGKKSLVVDLKYEKAQEIVKELIKDADVVVESFRPGVMDKMGLGYEELRKINPKLVMCSVSAFGQTGPYRGLPGYDIIAQALSGCMDLTGEEQGPPTKIGPSIADYTTSYNAYGAIVSALFHRERTGQGQHVDVCLLDSLVILNDYIESAFLGMRATRQGNHHGLVAPYGVFNSPGGSIVIGVLNPKLWSSFCELMGRPELGDDTRFNTVTKRVENLRDVIAVIEGWLQDFDDIKVVEKLLQEKGIPCALVKTTTDLINDPHLLARGTVTDFTVPELSMGKVKARGMHIKFSETKGKMGVPPKLGEHSEEILSTLGFTKDKMEELKKQGVC